MRKGRGEVMGHTHCDTIGDFFKNKYVLHIIQKWFRAKLKEAGVQKPGDLKVWKDRRNKKLGFTEEYEDFIRAIFQDSGEMEEFLAFLKAEYIDNEQVHNKLRDIFENGDFIRLFLSFRELADQLRFDEYDGVNRLTIGSIFSTKIAHILEKAHSVEVSETNENSIHRAMEELLEKGVSPISADGRILCYLGEGDTGGFEVKELGQKQNIVFEVKKNGFDILDADDFVKEEGENSLDIHAELGLLKKYLLYHRDMDSIELSEEQEKGYFQIRIDWEGKNKGNTRNENEIAFGRYLEQKIHDLEMQIRRKAKVVDIHGNPVEVQSGKAGRPEHIPEEFQLYSIPNT